jgi:hypothetical protein
MARERSRIERTVAATLCRESVGFVATTAGKPKSECRFNRRAIARQSRPATLSISISFNLFPHLKKLLRVVVLASGNRESRMSQRRAKRLFRGPARGADPTGRVPFARCSTARFRIILVNPQFRALPCPATVASKLSERGQMSRLHIFRVVQCIYWGRERGKTRMNDSTSEGCTACPGHEPKQVRHLN